jgi:cyclopropane-fatty-acyl-phospholipid synthase
VIVNLIRRPARNIAYEHDEIAGADAGLIATSHRMWAGKVDGAHRYSSEEWLKKYADELLAIMAVRGTLLDVGCGACQLTTYLAASFDTIYAIDFSETMLAAARQRVASLGIQNIRIISGTMQSYPSEVDKLDAVLSNGVVQYLTFENVLDHFNESRRVLKPGGVIYAAMIPNATHRHWYYRNILFPRAHGWRNRARRLAEQARRRLMGYFHNDVLWDGIGTWFEKSDIQMLASRAGFDVEFRNAWYYEYRFHAILTARA